MKIFKQPLTSLGVVANDGRWLVIAVTILLAVATGKIIAGNNWILIAAMLGLPILLLRPRELCLGCYAFLLPFDSISAVGPGGQTLTLLAGAALAAVLLGTTLAKQDLQRPARPALWWTLLIAWAAVTGLWALDWQPVGRKLFTAVSLLLVYLIVLAANISRKELQTTSLFVVAGAWVAALYTIFQFYSGALYHGVARGSVIAGSNAADPNYFAACLLLPLSLAISGFLTPRWWFARLAWLVVAGTLAFGILVTMSRGSLLALVVMMVFYMFTRQVSRRMTIPLVALFVVLAFFLPSRFFTRLQTAANTGGAGRTTIWKGGLVAFEHHGLVGAGISNFGQAYRENIGDAPMLDGAYVWGAHNSYLEVAVELGIVGFVLLLTAIVGQLRAASRCRKNASKSAGSVIVAYEAGCYAILVAGFFIGIEWEKWFWLAWILLAVAVRTAQAEQPIKASVTASKRAAWPWEDLPLRNTPGVRVGKI